MRRVLLSRQSKEIKKFIIMHPGGIKEEVLPTKELIKMFAELDLRSCFDSFPQFLKDYPLLTKKGFIIENDTGFEWTRSNTSLAQYFLRFIKNYNMSWVHIEAAFNIKKNSLKQLAYNSNDKKTKDYIDIIQALEPYR